MESQPQNPESGLFLKTFTHAISVILVQGSYTQVSAKFISRTSKRLPYGY